MIFTNFVSCSLPRNFILAWSSYSAAVSGSFYHAFTPLFESFIILPLAPCYDQSWF